MCVRAYLARVRQMVGEHHAQLLFHRHGLMPRRLMVMHKDDYVVVLNDRNQLQDAVQVRSPLARARANLLDHARYDWMHRHAHIGQVGD